MKKKQGVTTSSTWVLRNNSVLKWEFGERGYLTGNSQVAQQNSDKRIRYLCNKAYTFAALLHKAPSLFCAIPEYRKSPTTDILPTVHLNCRRKEIHSHGTVAHNEVITCSFI